MTEVEFAWLAGLLEGEGCFLAGPPSSPNSPRFTVEMTDRDVIERVSALCKSGGVVAVKPSGLGTQPRFKVGVYGPKAVSIADAIRPMMGERRQRQIDKMIACSKRRNYVSSTAA